MRTADSYWRPRRGSGSVGDDVTVNARTIRSVPLVLTDSKAAPAPRIVEVRGEVFMDNEDFQKVNKEIEAEGEEKYANPAQSHRRHLAPAGSEDRRQAAIAVFGPRAGGSRSAAGRQLLRMDTNAQGLGTAGAKRSRPRRQHR